MFADQHAARLWTLAVFLSLPLTGFAQSKSARGVHTPLISLPQGAVTLIRSPNQQWTLIFELQGVDEPRKLWIQHKGSSERRLVREFERSLDISWSPDSNHFFVNDASDSGQTRPYVFDPATLQSIDVAELVAKASSKADDYLGADHSYLEAKHWINCQELLLKFMAYFSEPAPRRPRLSGTYRFGLHGTVQKVREVYWR